MGLMQGDLVGSYIDDSDGWIAAGSGTWNGNRLAMSGKWGEEAGSLYRTTMAVCLWWGGYGLLGSTVPEWWNTSSFPVLARGVYDTYDTNDAPMLWVNTVQQHNAEMDDHTSLDGSAFYGLTAGIWKGRPDVGRKGCCHICRAGGTMGIINGSLDGEYYPGLGMWMAQEHYPQNRKTASR
jgi:hypothetical protein